MRYASGRKGFLGEFVDNLRQEFGKNQEMKENIKKFREEAKKLEESGALQQARRKYVRTFSRFPVLTSDLYRHNLSSALPVCFTRKLLRRRP